MERRSTLPATALAFAPLTNVSIPPDPVVPEPRPSHGASAAAPGPVDAPDARRYAPATVAMALCLVIGVAVRVWQYAANYSFWLDELAVANNLLQRGVWDLFTRPLDYAQVAPLGFLAMERLVIAVAGPSELALRAWSLAAGVGALFLTAFIANRLMDRRIAWVIAALVAISPSLVLQSAQLKPYTGDALFAVACVAMAMAIIERGMPRRWWGLAALGVVAPWWSFSSVFALAGLGVVVLLEVARRRDAQELKRVGVIMVLWGVSAAVSLWRTRSLIPPETTAYMNDYWSLNAPLAADSASVVLPWPLGRLRTLLWAVGDFRGATFLVPFVIIGAVALAARRAKVAAALVLPLLIGLVADKLGFYPMQARLALWALPLLACLLVYGFAVSMHAVLRGRWMSLRVAGAALLLVFPVLGFVRRRPPVPLGTARDVIEQVAAASPDGGNLYVHWRAWQAWTFYGSRLRPERWNVSLGSCSRSDRGLMLKELSRIRGTSLWILLSHLEAPFRERETVERFMETSGARLEREIAVARPPEEEAQFTHALLYDLSGVRWDDARADTLVASALAAVPARESECSPTYIPPRLDRSSP